MRSLPAILAVLAVAATIELAGAQPSVTSSAPPPTPLSSAERHDAVRAIETAIHETYVFPELRSAISAQLEHADQTHRYDVDAPDVFAQRVTDDLQSVSHDGHLYLEYDPEQYAALRAPVHAATGLDAYRREVAIREHHGLAKMDVLPGNIRYLQITAFRWTPGLTATAYDDAWRFLKDGDAIIVDLRGNGGGNSDAADYFSRAMLGPIRRARTPLYILVDGHTASAGEAVAYGAQQEKIATIVGSTTYGAANNNKKFPIAPSFVLSVSYHRPINPISGTNWENVGVVPDVPSPGTDALDAAALAALDALAASPAATPQRQAEYQWARLPLTARLHPALISPAHLATLAGTYGTIELRTSDAGLRLYRSDRPRWQPGLLLIPLTTDDIFAVEGTDSDLRIRLTGSTLELLHGSESAREVFPRTATGAEPTPH
jgi:Peptidase family S41